MVHIERCFPKFLSLFYETGSLNHLPGLTDKFQESSCATLSNVGIIEIMLAVWE